MRETRTRFNSACVLVALLLLVPLFSVNVAATSVPDVPTNLTAVGGTLDYSSYATPVTLSLTGAGAGTSSRW